MNTLRFPIIVPVRARTALPGPLLLLLLLLSGACGPGGSAGPPATGVVLITVDTLRADALGVYSPDAPATPAIDRLAERGTVFEQAVAPTPLTKPTHFSLFTGRYPREHGVVNNQLALPVEATTLAEVFREAGFRTGGFSGVEFFGRDSGASQGFEGYAAATEREAPAGAVVERALRWLRGVPEGERFLLWVHLYDPHMPYAPPAAHVPAQPPPTPEVGSTAAWRHVRAAARRHGGAVDEATYRRVRALYEGEVAYTDAEIGRLLDALGERTDAADVLVALTADHGECFGNGVYFRHSDCLYDGAVRVPLILSRAGGEGAGERVERQVETVHLPAALLRAAQVEVPRSFRRRPLLAGGAPDRVRQEGGEEPIAFFQPVLSDDRATRGRNRHWRGIESVAGDPARPALTSRGEPVGLRTGRWKYILGGFEDEELYDLDADPGEERNLAGEERRTAGRLRAEARRFLEEVEFEVLDEDTLSPELRESLRALGYL